VEAFVNLISWEQLLLCWLIVVVASALQIAAGMGFGMLASPLIALVKPELVPGCVLVMGIMVAIIGAWRERANIAGQEIIAGVSGRVIGSGVALMILLLLPDMNAFMILFGCVMLIAIALTTFGIKLAFTIKNLFKLSILSGVMGSLTAVGAPPMAIIYHGRSPSIIRPTLNAFFLFGCVLGLISLSLSGWFHWVNLLAALTFVPAMLVGIFIAQYARDISSETLSQFLLCLSAGASLLLILRGFGLLDLSIDSEPG